MANMLLSTSRVCPGAGQRQKAALSLDARPIQRRLVSPAVHRHGSRHPGTCGAKRAIKASANSPANDSVTASEVKESARFQNLLLTIMDSNEFLHDGSKQAVAMAAMLAMKDSGRVTVLVIDEPGTTVGEPAKQIECITWHLRNTGLDSFQVIQRTTTQPASVLIGDVADELVADMVVVSSEAVHLKHVDANQLAEFCSCPLLVLP